MNIEENRLQTFNEWPSDAVVSPSRLAKAGFFSTREGLTVECFSCHGKISEWNYGDQVMARHKTLSPTCPFVLNPTTSASGNIPSISSNVPSSSASLNLLIFENRLATFENWPVSEIVSPESLAQAGFYYLREGVNTKCAYCKGVIRAWEFCDDPDVEHKRHFPKCPFVLSTISPRLTRRNMNFEVASNTEIQKDSFPPSGNIPSISSNVPSSSASSNLLILENRLATFENWPVPEIVSPESLAQAGFYYLREGDNTKCAYCKGVVRAWEICDDPDVEHKRHFPKCPFVLSSINPRLARRNMNFDVASNTEIQKDSFPNVNLVGNDNLNELGVQAHTGPKRANFATVESRLRSFVRWPADLIQTPDVLSQAGFYYEGLGDQVRCFHCDGGLRHWDPQDDPWTEHARWFPQCSFVKLVKGQEFVTACSLENNVSSNLKEVVQKVPIPAPRRREVSERELQEHLNSPQALAALSIGLNVERVKRAIREKLEQTGRAYSQPDALVEAALNLQHEEDEDNMNEQDSHIANRVHVRNILCEVVRESQKVTSLQAPISPAEGSTPRIKNNGDMPKLTKTVSLEEENRILKEARLCKICMDSEVGIVFLPCGHLATCVNCAPNLEDCPVCRSAIKATVRTFLS